MTSSGVHTSLRILSHVVLLLMLAAASYALLISLVHWSGIGV